MSAVGIGVNDQVCLLEPVEVLLCGKMCGEKDASGINASIVGLLPQQLAPETEHLIGDLAGLAEVGHDHGNLGQSQLGSRGLLREWPAVVVM